MKLIILIFFVLTSLGCSTYGPLFKPDKDSIQNYIKNNPQLSDTIKEAILKREIIVGMSKNDVLALWGKPDEIYFPEGVYGKYSEEWLWKKILFNTIARDCGVDFFKDKVVDVGCVGGK